MLGIVESAWSRRELYNQMGEQRVDICLHVRWPRIRIYVKSEVQPARYRTEVGRTSDYWKTTGILGLSMAEIVSGAGDGDRTRDPLLGRQMLYH